RILFRSPTIPRSENSKIGAFWSLLIATMFSLACMPTLCWIAPEIPAARYSFGATVLPVWPICAASGYQPASTTARVAAPVAPPDYDARFAGVVDVDDGRVVQDRALRDALAVLRLDARDLHRHAAVETRGHAGADREAEQATAEQRVLVTVVLDDLRHRVDD